MSANLPLVRDTLTSATEAVEDELRAAQSQPSSRYRLYDGRCVGRSVRASLWSWSFDGDIALAPESSGELHIDGAEPVAATVVSVGDLELLLAVMSTELVESAATADFVAQPLFILRELKMRLSGANGQLLDSTMLEQLLDLVDLPEVAPQHPPNQPTDDTDPIEPNECSVPLPEGLSAEQAIASEHATREGLRFVWGPPGTGKTATLAATVSALAWAGRKTMVVAHSNVAVDVAMVRVAEMLTNSPLIYESKVLRVGTPHLTEMYGHPEILPSEITLQKYPELADSIHRLQDERARLSALLLTAPSKEPVLQSLADVRRQLLVLNGRLSEEEDELVRGAQVVGCTLAKAILDGTLWSWPKDALIVDEASMAALPYLMALVTEPPTTVACFGDFRQLPPVAVSRSAAAQAWFGRDVFEVAGVIERIEAGDDDPRLAILRTQYRMGETIAEAVSRVAYFSLLSTHVDAVERARQICEIAPEDGREVVLVDTASLGALAQTESDVQLFSRFNLRTGALAASLAGQLGATGRTVAVISPYRAQVSFVHALTRSMRNVAAATMHRFQGSERDAVVLDLVDAPPLRGPSQLTGKNEDLTLRLLNVGISRARGKLIVLGDFGFFQSALRRTAPTLQFIDAFRELGAAEVDAASLAQEPGEGSVTWTADWWDSVEEMCTVGSSPHLTIGLPSSTPLSENGVNRLRSLHRLVPSLTVHAPIEIAQQLEGGGFTLRLMPISPLPVAVATGRGVVVGANQAGLPTAVLHGDGVRASARRLLNLEM